MTTQPPTFRTHALASTAHVAARLVTLLVLTGALAAGFVAGVSAPPAAAPEQLASTPASCGARPC